MARSSIIFLNGASSSGKTTLGRVLRALLDKPYFYLSSDQLVEARVLPRVDRSTSEGMWAWRTIRPHFFEAFHNCIAAFATAGIDLIVEHVLEFKSWYEDCVRLLNPFGVFHVGIHCPMEELERTERTRGNRWIGEGRSHIEDGIHTWGPYDFELDSSLQTVEDGARMIIDAYSRRSTNSAFSNEHERLTSERR
jgi:chloramphenicol 3-O phosphotransferase